MVGRVEGKTALVTGAAQGLGAAIAARLAEEGAQVFATDLNQDKGEAVARDVGAVFLAQDVSEPADWANVLKEIETAGRGLHILVNNAGIEGDPSAPKDPENAPHEDWSRIFRVNADSVFLGCKAATALMAKSGGGAITNMSSVAALAPTPFITAYGASKAAVAHLSRSVALHCAQQGYAIRCNSVHPGQVRTPMLDGLFARWADEQGATPEAVADGFRETIPLGAFQDPVDIANMVLFLSSDEARYVTGQAIAVDGGFTLVN
ncbi:MAG: glucose 1-dehydrogenase [Pseudomonadota bacterium]